LDGGDPLKGASYNIRGKGSREHDGVLWVVDGVPGAPYNVEDIETITVLKDGASAAIYGAQVGASGVILITTKKAQAGKVKVDVNVSHGFKNAWKVPETVTAEQYMQLWKDAADAATGNVNLPIAADPQRYAYGAVTRTNWMDEVLRTGEVQHYAVSLSGGSETLKALASFSYDKNEGIMLNTYSESFGGKMNIDLQVAPWLKVSERATVTYSNGQGDVWNGSHEGVLLSAVFYPRSATVYEYNEDGSPVLNDNNQPVFGGTIPRWAVAQGVSGYGEIRNPVAELSRMRQNRPSANIYSTSTLEIKPISALTLRSDFTVGLMPSRNESFESRVPEYGRPSAQNARYISSIWHSKYLWDNTATYAKAFDEHHISAMAGYTYQYESNHDNRTVARNFDKEDEHYTIFTNATEWTDKPSEDIWEEWMASQIGRIGYSFSDRYFATASIRRDVSSKLHPDNNADVFSAFSASWKISSEAFFNLPFVNLLKLRGGWGEIGNVNSVNRYSYNVPLAVTSNAAAMGKDTQGILYGIYQRTISNPDLKWERSEQTSVGLDAAFLNNSLNVTIDWYRKLTKGLVDNLPIPQTAGIEVEPKGNVGEMQNTGWELGVSYNTKIQDVSVNVYGNLNGVKGKVLDLGYRSVLAHTNSVNGGTMRPLFSEVGQPWYAYKLIKTDGLFQSQTEIDNYISAATGHPIQPNARPGDLKFVDYNNDGMINDDDRQYMGSYLPELTYSFGANLGYKGFDFSFYFQGITGVKTFNGFKMMGLSGRGQGSYMLADALDNWTYNHNSNIPRLSLLGGDTNGNFDKPSDFLLEDGSYLRLKNITVGYTLPKNILQGVGLRIYAGIENLLTITNYSGFDPEVGNLGLDAGTYPVARSFNLGFNLNF
jgi:TonB-linked SusC/RagA family outer membrane protein